VWRRTGGNRGRRASGHATLGSVAAQLDSGSARADLRRLSLSALRPTSWRDLALCLTLLGAWVIQIAVSGDQRVTIGRGFGVVIATVPFVALAWRPRLGERLLAMAAICWLSAAMLDVAAPDDIVIMVAIYTIATQAAWRRIIESVLFGLTFAAIVPAIEGNRADAVDAIGSLVAWVLLAGFLVALARWIARRRLLIESLLDRARHMERERDLLAAERDEMARQAVAEERARIARELHDVVAHHVSVMVIQAGAAEASLPPDATAAAQSIGAIRETGREALAEMRRMLGLLRSREAAASADDAVSDGGRTPQPGLADIAALCERMREAGVDVTTEVAGTARRLPAGVDLSIFRVVQEALTNTLRHGGPGSKARLRLSYGAESLTAEVTDDGRGHPAVGTVERARQGVGHGLLGMRERVLLFGGRLETGPLPGGGFRVMACFPLEPRTEEPEPTMPPAPGHEGGVR
jgi:signal transduction histidine kinase